MVNSHSEFADTDWASKAGGKLLVYKGSLLKQSLDRDAVAKYVRQRGALGAMWTYDYGCCQEGPWYRYICDTPGYGIEKIKSKNSRYYVRRSLKNCIVRAVDYEWLADNGYEVYISAASRYSYFTAVSMGDFAKEMREYSRQPGREAMGVFVDGKLAAFATLRICEKSVRIYGSQFDPAYSKDYPMYALYYTIAHHYLKERGYQEADNGCRALRHDTNIGDFLVRLGWRKQYCRLGLYLRWPVRIVLWAAGIFRPLCKLVLPSQEYASLESLLAAQDIAKATKEG